MPIRIVENLGQFYLGQDFDLDRGQVLDQPTYYDSQDLTTHAACVGMTGSGKTGLCVALLEEAAIDGIPAIAIDPKGDLGNLCLTFPQLRPEDFGPWIDPAEAARRGIAPADLAAETARRWRDGLDASGQTGRIDRLRAATDVAIYTPGSGAGLPLTVLRSFAAPPSGQLDDEALRDRIAASAGGLLALIGIEGDPLQSREHILISNVLDRAWRAGHDVDLPLLIRQIQAPPFDRLGAFELDTFFPFKDRQALAMRLNNLLASPSFAGWLEGEPLDIQRLLYTAAGKPRLSVVSIAHLSDAERMFLVTLLLNEVIAWMRRQPGTSSLRALLYMDEIFGFFPPVGAPPSKTPMLTLLKQARAFGLGIVLATQNPVDLDYKGLANTGTWFLGRLQTERDKARVLDGLEGASATSGSTFDRARVEAILSGLGNRVFFLHNVHEPTPVVFQSRWALSYLRGPLTRVQIETLMAPRKAAAAPIAAVTPTPVTATASAVQSASEGIEGELEAPLLPADVESLYAATGTRQESAGRMYQAHLVAVARRHFVSTKQRLDFWESIRLIAPIDDDMPADIWEDADEMTEDHLASAQRQPAGGVRFARAPTLLLKPASYKTWSKQLKTHLYQQRPRNVQWCPLLGTTSQPGQPDAEFRIALAQQAREARDTEKEKLRQRYGPKQATLEDRIRRARQAVDKEQSQSRQHMFQSAISVGASVLGALIGRKKWSQANLGRATTSARSVGRAMEQREDVGRATERLEDLEEQLKQLDNQCEEEIQAIQDKYDADHLPVETLQLAPRKSDLVVDRLVVLWDLR